MRPNSSPPPPPAEKALALAGFGIEDQAEARILLGSGPDTAVSACLRLLSGRLGQLAAPPLSTPSPGPDGRQSGGATVHAEGLLWLEAYLRFLPQQLGWYQRRGIAPSVVQRTVADIGRQTAISRRTLGSFSLETWRWLAEQASGMLYQLGRLQFQMIPRPDELFAADHDDIVLSVHIPESGPLRLPEVVDAFQEAQRFFATFFPEYPVRYAECTSWLLDPYLLEHLPEDANISQFSRLFTPYGTRRSSNEDAVYFTFRSRDHGEVSGLPRSTGLQRLVIERIENGDTWQVARGYLNLADIAPGS